MNSEWAYQTDKVVLVPYSSKETTVFNESILGDLYARTKADGLLDTIFCGMPPITYASFVCHLASLPTQIYCVKRDEIPIPAGFCWISNMNGCDGCRLGMFGFGFFREYWGRPEVRDLVFLCLAFWFKELKIDMLYGITKSDNFLARNFSRRFGFQEIAVVPGFLYSADYREDARIVMLNKKDFMPLFTEWHEKQLEAMTRG